VNVVGLLAQLICHLPPEAEQTSPLDQLDDTSLEKDIITIVHAEFERTDE
jgi:hypothetical protein